MKKIILLAIAVVLLFTQACTNQTTVRVGDNAFFYNGKIYQVVENRVELLCDINADSIQRAQIVSQEVKSFGKVEIEGEADAYTEVAGVFRGGALNFKFEVKSFKDLFEKYTDGSFLLTFKDKSGFPVIAANVPISELNNFEYTGRVALSFSDWMAVEKCSVSADLVRKEEPKKVTGTYDDNSWY